jgi:hypothetical protein
MKRGVLLLFLVIGIGLVSADHAKITLEKGQNFVIDGRNVTLLRFSDSEGKVVLCINNHRYIFDENKQKIVDNLRVEITRIRIDRVELNLKGINMAGSDCNEDCSNDKCMISEKPGEEVITEPSAGEIPEAPQENKTSEIVTSTNGKANIYIVIFITALIILIIISSILLFKRV